MVIVLAAVLATGLEPPQLVEPAPPPPPPEPKYVRLGLRVGAGAFPLDGRAITTLGLIQLTADVELASRTRTFAEYELLMLMQPEPHSEDGIGHRANLGIMRDVLVKDVRDARFSVVAEAGGGVTLITGAIGDRTIMHAFAGVRAGFELRLDHDAKHPPTFGFELLFRGIAVPGGAGAMFGIGMQWGE